MSTVSIPKWTAEGVVPPIDLTDPVSPSRSPYRVSLTDFVLRFGTSRERCSIIRGLLRYRAAIHAVGLTRGFQWFDGGFLENVEVMESRPPNDVDTVTFYRLAPSDTQAIVFARDPNAFSHAKMKADFHVDAYLVGLDQPSEQLVAGSAYWYSVWSHRRNQAWKGFVEIDLDPTDDAAASKLLATLPATGGTP
jgi:hypothetical protein